VGNSYGPRHARQLRAAGGLVHRGTGSALEIALVYRPRYSDWSLPKGKLRTGEIPVRAAVREVGEETGTRVAVTRRLQRITYDVAGEPKTVDYWAMRALDTRFEAGREVSELAWLTPAQASQRLSYAQDRAVVEEFAASGPVDSVVTLLRHARAGKRSQWTGEDALRPLESRGIEQSLALAPFLELFAPRRVLAADRLRCVQTVDPLANLLGRPVEVAAEFNDEAFLRAPRITLERLLELAADSVCICSQGYTVPALIDALGLAAHGQSSATHKGATWAISVVAGRPVQADYYRTPSEPH
jgi:8-oxo-dGTP pyrophosphatase MutT (NUDIX family)/phosphohistidine phosphatase SixA